MMLESSVSLESCWGWEDSALADYTEMMPGFDLENCKRVLVLGCGPARKLNEIAALHPEVEFIGVDFNEGYIKTAKENAPKNAAYIQSCFTKLKVDKEGFDLVYCWGVYSSVLGTVRGALEALFVEVVKKGGHVVFTYDNALHARRLERVRDVAILLGRRCDGDSTEVLKHLSYFFPEKNSLERKAIEAMRRDPDQAKHFILQPHWAPLYSEDVALFMSQAGFEYAPNDIVFSEAADIYQEILKPNDYYRVERWCKAKA